jgi:hypothetical protein
MGSVHSCGRLFHGKLAVVSDAGPVVFRCVRNAAAESTSQVIDTSSSPSHPDKPDQSETKKGVKFDGRRNPGRLITRPRATEPDTIRLVDDSTVASTVVVERRAPRRR